VAFYAVIGVAGVDGIKAGDILVIDPLSGVVYPMHNIPQEGPPVVNQIDPDKEYAAAKANKAAGMIGEEAFGAIVDRIMDANPAWFPPEDKT